VCFVIVTSLRIVIDGNKETTYILVINNNNTYFTVSLKTHKNVYCVLDVTSK